MPLPTKSKIYFFFQTKVFLRDRNRLKIFIGSIFEREGKILGSLNYVFCSDDTIRSINRQYLNHDYYTDIISFELSTKGDPIEGEIYISVDRVKDNAQQLGLTFTNELHRVIFHGALHLCGYKDKSESEIGLMRKAENRYLDGYFS